MPIRAPRLPTVSSARTVTIPRSRTTSRSLTAAARRSCRDPGSPHAARTATQWAALNRAAEPGPGCASPVTDAANGSILTSMDFTASTENRRVLGQLEGGVDRGMQQRRVRDTACARSTAPTTARRAIPPGPRVRRAGDDRQQTALPLDGGVPRGHAALGHQRVEHAVHRGPSGLQGLGVTAVDLADARRLGGRHSHRVRRGGAAESERTRARRGRGEVTGGPRHLPATLEVGDARGARHPGAHLEPRDVTRQRLRTGQRPHLGDRQHRGPHAGAEVDRRLRRIEDVIEIHCVRGYPLASAANGPLVD